MKPKKYEGKTPDEIRQILSSGKISRSTHFRIRRETGICAEKVKPDFNANRYEVNRGKWV